jgi:predicted nucleic acid-binding protein
MAEQPSQWLILDASIIIDLYLGSVLEKFLELPYQFAAPDQIIVELLDPAGEKVVLMGVARIALTSDQLREVFVMKAQYNRLSIGDVGAFLLARDMKAVLLTGDGLLRSLAESTGVAVHGVLWALDELEIAELLTGPALAASLHRMLDEGARLPTDECESRFRRWASSDE